jgi:hypothetical protein
MFLNIENDSLKICIEKSMKLLNLNGEEKLEAFLFIESIFFQMPFLDNKKKTSHRHFQKQIKSLPNSNLFQQFKLKFQIEKVK